MNNAILNTGIRLVKNVGSFNFGAGSLDDPQTCEYPPCPCPRQVENGHYIIDEFCSQPMFSAGCCWAARSRRVRSTEDEPKRMP